MKSLLLHAAGALLVLNTSAHAATITFATDPFEGVDVSTPGRQIIGDELFTNFSIQDDVFLFDRTIFGIDEIRFATDVAANLPEAGHNVIVLRDLDNDANPATPFRAADAADLIADRVTTPGAGFFLYFNSGLDLPRLVFSTDLSDRNADLKVLARLLNLNGPAGRDALSAFNEGNFEATTATPVPEPTSLLLLASGVAACVGRSAFRRPRLRG